MIPGWKLKRELKRPLDQLRSAILYPIDRFTQWHHDRGFHNAIHVTKGEQDAGRKFAILLIYQPKKLAETTLMTCQHLADNGYSVLLVSNTALPDESRSKLTPVVWRILERPNIGYDFGGYRDGIRFLREAKVPMEALVIVNDSIWWPLCAKDTALERAEIIGADVVGMILRPPGRPRKRTSNRSPHLQSYFFWFNKKTLESEAFTGFWTNYTLSSFKYNTIRRGELRLTKVLMEGGLTVAPLFSVQALMEKLHQQTDDYLSRVLFYGVNKDSEMAQRAKALETAVTRDDAWRNAVFALFHEMDRRSEFHLALRFACVDLLGLNFLKKSATEPKNSMFHVGRSNYLTAIRNGELPSPMPEVLSEIEERHRLGSVAVGR